jgi:hypothetical protein
MNAAQKNDVDDMQKKLDQLKHLWWLLTLYSQ